MKWALFQNEDDPSVAELIVHDEHRKRQWAFNITLPMKVVEFDAACKRTEHSCDFDALDAIVDAIRESQT